MSLTKKKAILSIDIGTTNLKVCIFSGDNCALIYGQTEEILLITSKDDQNVEIDPEQLWTQILTMVRNAVTEADKMNLNLVGIGLSCQRNSFVTLNR
ncbi:hypothetical protein Mgra_00007204 [Meloidogyne graminicola]|uniref:Carbohydrate kinase FGGY N-terminal domain-containing protein n=1 Tax=Meloidogyne graminicola TaxID=189291 RepID=A0A8S9ZJG7_9BILA|nr:hypothetical protein Mgra_00007204 [Meloidogyne graminicola]